VNALFRPPPPVRSPASSATRRGRWSPPTTPATRGVHRGRAEHLVTDGTLLKVYAWYDNEMGYACRMVDLACHMERAGL
jgi:hypothetical protein